MQRADAIAFYKAVSKFILPHLRNRPLSFQRYVDAIPGEFFWEKDAPSYTPARVTTFAVPRREGPPIDYIIANDVKTLTWIASIGAVDLHPFLHVIPRIEIATHVVFDLDPGEGADILDCAKVALLLRELLELECFAKVSGSKGIQVYVPLNSGASHELTETYARLIADEMARRYPKLVVSKMAKTLRHKKVFIDWSQNADYKTTVAVYSLRANRGLVSMPVTWEELERAKNLEFTPKQAIARLKKVGDLFAPVLKMKQKLPGQKSPSSFPLERRALSPASGRAESPSLQKEPDLPKRGSQSGRRLFLLTKTETGNELWTEMGGLFRRWLLRRGGVAYIGEFSIDPAYYRGEVPVHDRDRVTLEDAGAYETVEGSDASGRFALWFSGRVMTGPWTLTKKERKSWRLSKG